MFNDAGCPYCGRRLTLEGFDSAECQDAGILHLWHLAKNGDLKPSQVSGRTAKMIWLQCPTCGYEWRENLRGTRKESRKCPSCHGGRRHYLAKGGNDLGSKRPDVARRLDPELNGDLRAEDLHAHAGAMVWWRGSCGHVWREKVSMRSMRVDDSCPYCKNSKLLRGFNDLATTHPELVAEWDFERNGDLGPDGARLDATKQVWWRGSCGREWQMSPRQRAAEGLGCPYCSGHRVLAGFNDLASQHPELPAEWDWGAQRRPGVRRHRLRQREEGLVEMRAWARMADIRLQQDRRRRPRLPLLRRPQGAERLQRPEDDASRDREGVEQGAQRRPEADRRDRQLQQARLVEVQGGPRVVRPRSEPGAQGQGGPGLPVLLGAQGARRLQRPGRHASRHSGHVAPAYEQALEAHRRAGRKPQARMVARRVRPRLPDGRPRQGEGQAGLLPVLLREEEAREADKARLALGPSARKEWGRRVGASCL